MVTSRYNATRPRAWPTGTEKNTVLASDSSTRASPAAETPCIWITLARPDSPAPWAWVALISRRYVARPARAETPATLAVPRPTARAPSAARSPLRGLAGRAPAACVHPAVAAPRGPTMPRSRGQSRAWLMTTLPLPWTWPARPRRRSPSPGRWASTRASSPRASGSGTHSFDCTSPAYRGWRWAVTVARAPRSRTATVDEVHLLPGVGALLAPTWLPWSDRIAPGDLGAGDLLPFNAEDPRLEPGFEATGDEDADQLAFWELGLGRERVLSPEGRAEAAERWYDGAHGPHTPVAEQAPAPCASCGFFLPMAGTLRAGLRRLQQRVVPVGRPGRLARPRLRCAQPGRRHARAAAGRAAHPRRARLRRPAAPGHRPAPTQ